MVQKIVIKLGFLHKGNSDFCIDYEKMFSPFTNLITVRAVVGITLENLRLWLGHNLAYSSECLANMEINHSKKKKKRKKKRNVSGNWKKPLFD